MNLISTIIGLSALAMGLIGIFPQMGWLNWLVLFLAFLGMVFGLSDKEKTTGIVINFLAIVFAVIRLYLNGGIV
jgi:putative exporter of polyketide antibiotics